MNNIKDEDLGLAGVRMLADDLGIDDGQSINIERGIAWWAKDFRQRIWAEERIVDMDVPLWRIHVVTDLLADVDLSRQETRAWLGATLPFSTQYAWVHDPGSGHLRLWSSLWVHADVLKQRIDDLATAAVLQVTDAQIRAPMLEERFDETADVTERPSAGRRATSDDVFHVVNQVLVPSGKRESAWSGSDEFEKTVALFKVRANAYGNGDPTGLTLEFSFGAQTSMLQLLTDQANPQLGNGLLQLLHLPIALDMDACLDFAMRLNREETMELTRTPLLGSWCASQRGEDWVPVFVGFRSNASRKKGDIGDVTMSQAIRARWVAEKYAHEPDRSVVTGVMDRLRGIFSK